MTNKSQSQASERRCAQRMHQILQGRFPVDADIYTVDDIAERYLVHRDSVYKAVRAGSPLFPEASRKGQGPKAWLHFTADAIQTADRNRIAFYRTTPSWHMLFGRGAEAAPVRRAAKTIIQALEGGPAARTAD